MLSKKIAEELLKWFFVAEVGLVRVREKNLSSS